MTRGDEQRISDIIEACTELSVLVELRASGAAPEGVALRAAERLLEIIGEAGNSISAECKSRYPGVDWPSIGRLRNLLAHD